MIQSPEIQAKIAEWRRRISAGEPLSPDEQREAIQILRAGRLSATQAPAKKATSKAPVNVADLLASL